MKKLDDKDITRIAKLIKAELVKNEEFEGDDPETNYYGSGYSSGAEVEGIVAEYPCYDKMGQPSLGLSSDIYDEETLDWINDEVDYDPYKRDEEELDMREGMRDFHNESIRENNLLKNKEGR